MRTRREWLALGFGAVGALPLIAQNGPGGGKPPAVLTAEESARLLLMREEEKLAHDVYVLAGERWNVRIFPNIAQSETAHFRQVGRLLTTYNLPDPAAGRAAGEFADPRMAALYFDLTTKVALSLKDALEVGVLIEKTDIADLEVGIAEAKQADIKKVYANLLNASYNHLESFEANLELLAAAAS